MVNLNKILPKITGAVLPLVAAQDRAINTSPMILHPIAMWWSSSAMTMLFIKQAVTAMRSSERLIWIHRQSQGTFFAQKAIEFMEENKDNRFLLWLAFNEPHAPFHYPAEYAEIKNILQQDLLSWFSETHPDAANLPVNLSTEGKLMWFCEPRDVGAEFGGRPLRVLRPSENR